MRPCEVKPRPLIDDWTGLENIYDVIGYRRQMWACLMAASCQWLAAVSRGPPCYATQRQQAWGRNLERSSDLSVGSPNSLYPGARCKYGEGGKYGCHIHIRTLEKMALQNYETNTTANSGVFFRR